MAWILCTCTEDGAAEPDVECPECDGRGYVPIVEPAELEE